LVAAEEVGEKIAESVMLFFEDPNNRKLIEKLESAGLQFQSAHSTPQGTKLEGLTIVISGSFETHSREELKKMIEENGGKNAGSISARTDYLLGGEGIGPSKMQKVQELGIPLISEEEFLKMLE
jgi:DNA ligase (NAD+)